jgi:hypothetical protein
MSEANHTGRSNDELLKNNAAFAGNMLMAAFTSDTLTEGKADGNADGASVP